MPQPVTAPLPFASLGVPAILIDPLTERGLSSAFPIQAATLPDTLAGRDVLGRGRTGSGKTLAFALPMVARLARLVPSAKSLPAQSQPGRPRGLVLAPTRELANQILATIAPLASAAGLNVMTIFGGVNQGPQVSRLRRGADIVVATPGRLEDLIGQGHVRLDAVAITVLDEADHMADLGFLPGVTRILTATPQTGQRMLFSATLDHGVDTLVKRFLSDPLVHSVDSADSPVAAMTHHVFLLRDASEKKQVVRELAAGSSRRLLFTRTKHQARKLARELTAAGVPSVELHGNLSQNARERGLKAFADGDVKVMVATDIAARGIHVDDIDLVVHVDPPAEHKAYLHRSGRTARAGNDGDVITLVLPEQRRDFQVLARAAKISAQPAQVGVGDARVQELTGDPAAFVAPQNAHGAAARKGDPQTDQPNRRTTSGRQASSKGHGGSSRQSDRGVQNRNADGAGRGGTSSKRNDRSSGRGSTSNRNDSWNSTGSASRASGAPSRSGWGSSRGSASSGAGSQAVVQLSQQGARAGVPQAGEPLACPPEPTSGSGLD